MRIGEGLLAELEQEAATTLRVLERVPEDKLAWKPHEKSMALGALALHTADTPGQVARMVEGDTFSSENYTGPPAPANKQEILDAHKSGLEIARAYLRSLDDARAQETWKFLKDGKEMISMPRVVAIRVIMLNHHYHHRGQLSVYLRLLDIPVPSIYGPSADEQPPGM